MGHDEFEEGPFGVYGEGVKWTMAQFMDLLGKYDPQALEQLCDNFPVLLFVPNHKTGDVFSLLERRLADNRKERGGAAAVVWHRDYMVPKREGSLSLRYERGQGFRPTLIIRPYSFPMLASSSCPRTAIGGIAVEHTLCATLHCDGQTGETVERSLADALYSFGERLIGHELAFCFPFSPVEVCLPVGKEVLSKYPTKLQRPQS
ncbi:hypothetical protein H6501_03625 [Candidatus Woesearchaeota archaeon]|nr:hypothetical protein [Nanoarchaeota archaeon]MCB9370660.1 hypothetical protein [Candidatus Woesearchaeota archaeon]USN43744.1 MAG: hypothetical protein H6500_05125 [Candidatus Woesearchaeota archaeon]